MAGSTIPADGTAWNEAVPDDGQPHGNDYNEHHETKMAVRIRMCKEHVTFAASSVGGEHKPGSAVIYVGDYSSASAGDALPTTKPDGATALDADDAGRLAYDTDAVYGGILYKWSGSAWAAFGVMLTAAQTIAGVKTFSSFPVTPSSAPTTDYQVSNKKYVDDTVAATKGYFASGATIFNTTLTAANTFQDLDLSATVGANACLCFIQITANGTTGVVTKPKGVGGTAVEHFSNNMAAERGCSSMYVGSGYYGYIICATDSAGVIQIGSSSSAVTITMTLIGYVK